MERSMRNILFCVLILLPAVLSKITLDDLNYDEDLRESNGKKYDIKGSFELQCKVTATESETFTVRWERNGKDVKDLDKTRYSERNSGNSYGFKWSNAQEQDAGNYTCVVIRDNAEIDRKSISLYGKVHIKTPASLNVIEGESFKIVCQVVGKPAPAISWRVGNETYTEDTDRVELQKDPERDVENAVFVIKKAEMSDRGTYECIATPEFGNEITTSTMVRVKDKYAALWPFLAICAEVFALCAVILIYEKKRNKTELDESDTDQSPDQKNTPDHGKDSSLRHRQ